MKKPADSAFSAAIVAMIIVAALGYFVDVYDLILFSIVRLTSLKDMGLNEEQCLVAGVQLINWQMFGMLIGGVIWGILGDKKGRITVLFASILLYSAANLANAYANSVWLYATLRFIAGVGLAGELGAGITLVSESLPKDKRGLGTTLVATIGVVGALLAVWVGRHFAWRTAYIIGGVLGLFLLALRISVRESALFKRAEKQASKHRGNFFKLFTPWSRCKKYLFCIFSGLPIWFVLGLLVTFAPELGKALNLPFPLTASDAVFYAYVGMIVGDMLSGLVSQALRSRKKTIGSFITLSAVVCYLIIRGPEGMSVDSYHWLYFLAGFGIGYWAVFVTMASEQFGTNMRATVTTSVPNFVRGSVVLQTSLFALFKNYMSLPNAMLSVGGLMVVVAFYSLSNVKESFNVDLDFLEDVQMA